jgi:hypothetical protein
MDGNVHAQSNANGDPHAHAYSDRNAVTYAH